MDLDIKTSKQHHHSQRFHFLLSCFTVVAVFVASQVIEFPSQLSDHKNAQETQFAVSNTPNFIILGAQRLFTCAFEHSYVPPHRHTQERQRKRGSVCVRGWGCVIIHAVVLGLILKSLSDRETPCFMLCLNNESTFACLLAIQCSGTNIPRPKRCDTHAFMSTHNHKRVCVFDGFHVGVSVFLCERICVYVLGLCMYLYLTLFVDTHTPRPHPHTTLKPTQEILAHAHSHAQSYTNSERRRLRNFEVFVCSFCLTFNVCRVYKLT